MGIAKLVVIALGAFAVLATPVFAKNTKLQKTEAAEDAAPTCSSYQLGPDGNWIPVSCQELGAPSSQQHRVAPKDQHDEAH